MANKYNAVIWVVYKFILWDTVPSQGVHVVFRIWLPFIVINLTPATWFCKQSRYRWPTPRVFVYVYNNTWSDVICHWFITYFFCWCFRLRIIWSVESIRRTENLKNNCCCTNISRWGFSANMFLELIVSGEQKT